MPLARAHDKFQIINRHAADEMIYPQEGYLGLNYTPGLIIIQVTWVRGRSTDIKKRFYRRIAEIHEKGGVRKEELTQAAPRPRGASVPRPRRDRRRSR